MSGRNFRQMGEPKLRAALANFASLDADDQAKAASRADALGIPVPAPAADPPAEASAPAGMPTQCQNAKGGHDVATTLAGHLPSAFQLEPKLDGFRLLVHRTPTGEVHAWTRGGRRVDAWLPTICHELAQLPENTILDGELVLLKQDAEGGVQTGTSYDVQSVMNQTVEHAARVEHTLTYVAFDCMRDHGHDATREPLHARRSRLESLLAFPREWAHVMLAPVLPATQACHDKLVVLGWEGSIIKDRQSKYSPGKRGAGWTKLKQSDTIDVEILRVNEGDGRCKNTCGSIDCRDLITGKLVTAGTGLDDATRDLLWEQRATLPGQVAEISHMAELDNGFRHPVWLGVRTDRAVGVA